MSRQPPVPGTQQQAVMLQAVFRLILHPQNSGGRTPEGAIALGATNEIFLVVDAAEEDVAAETGGEDSDGLEVREDDGVAGEVLRLEGVDTGEPDEGAPREIEAEMVVADIDGSEVPVFVDEEVDDVDGVEERADEDGLGDEAMELVLVGDEGEVAWVC